jgi:hypothetical protein
MDWSVHPKSNIKRLPKPIWPLALAARNVRDLVWPKPLFRADGITTIHNTRFMDSERFKRSYARAVQAGGWDFGIPYRVHQALWCSNIAQRVEGDFVELGTGRGFVMSALLEDGLKRPLHLFDTFLSNYLDASGCQTEAEASPYYANSFEAVEANFSEWPNVRFHRGNVYETIPAAKLSRVAFLHVDMNHPDPEEFGVRELWPLMPRGAVLLFDDYAFAGCDRQFDRINELAKELGFDVLATPTGQGIAIK